MISVQKYVQRRIPSRNKGLEGQANHWKEDMQFLHPGGRRNIKIKQANHMVLIGVIRIQIYLFFLVTSVIQTFLGKYIIVFFTNSVHMSHIQGQEANTCFHYFR